MGTATLEALYGGALAAGGGACVSTCLHFCQHTSQLLMNAVMCFTKFAYQPNTNPITYSLCDHVCQLRASRDGCVFKATLQRSLWCPVGNNL